jgi:dihydropteroate synthase
MTLDDFETKRIDFSKGGAFNPVIIGILNLTPDSFYPESRCLTSPPEEIIAHAFRMIDAGADWLDIGGESTRPGASPIMLDVELSRVIPVIRAIRHHSDICISIDTQSPQVMEAALLAGASCINDINALQHEGALSIAQRFDVPVILMHKKGMPETMQLNPEYPLGVIHEAHSFFEERIQACLNAGIKRDKLILDPGFGFGKTLEHNLELLRHLSEFKRYGLPLCVGLSRKHMIGQILNQPVEHRLIGSVIAAGYALQQGAHLFRVHDVRETKEAIVMLQSIILEQRINA